MAILNRLKKNKRDDAPKKEKKVASKAVSKKSAKKVSQKVSDEKVTKVFIGANAHRILIEPLVTEKATLTGAYYFRVHPDANKSEVAKAIEKVYGVKPKTVRMMNVLGKKVRTNSRKKGKRANWKKAIVRLKSGETINVYEGT